MYNLYDYRSFIIKGFYLLSHIDCDVLISTASHQTGSVDLLSGTIILFIMVVVVIGVS